MAKATDAGRRGEVVAAAARVFADRGYRATSMNEIAEAVGLSKAGLYHHVRSKEELLVQLYEEGLAEQLAAERAIVAEGLGPEQTLRRLLEARVVHACHNLQLQKIQSEEEAELPAELMGTVQRHRRQRARLLVDVVTEGIARGEFHPSVSPRIAVITMLGAVNFVYKWYDPAGGRPAEQLAAEIAEYLVSGLRPAATA
jgi:AcrR family transcriptional regulator